MTTLQEPAINGGHADRTLSDDLGWVLLPSAVKNDRIAPKLTLSVVAQGMGQLWMAQSLAGAHCVSGPAGCVCLEPWATLMLAPLSSHCHMCFR